MAKLYYFETLNPSKCATAKLLGSPVDYVRLDLAKGEHKSAASLARNPNGKVPVLVEGDFKLWESLAIMMWLAGEARSELTSDPTGQAASPAGRAGMRSTSCPRPARSTEHHINPQPASALRTKPLAAATPRLHNGRQSARRAARRPRSSPAAR